MNAPAITDIVMTQRRRFGANIPIIVFAIVNVSGTQHRAFYDDYSMHVFDIINALMVQRRRFSANIPMNVFAIMNVSGTQHRAFYDDYSIHVFDIINALMVQLGTSCSFDSPGLARDEPTPGKRSQGDSTP